MDDLRHLMAAYFHQDWWDEYDGSWESGVHDFARRSPQRVPGLLHDIDTLLDEQLTDDELGRRLDDLGNYRHPGDSPSAHIVWLQCIRQLLVEDANAH